MNQKRDRRHIIMTKAALQDARDAQYTDDEIDTIIDNLNQVAEQHKIPFDHRVTAIRCTGGAWFRMKLRDPNVRVLFQFDPNTLVVWGILRRTNGTYITAEIRWQKLQDMMTDPNAKQKR